MIIVAGFIDVDAGLRGEFLEAMGETIVATRSEPGCIEYTFAADAVDPGRVRLFERWETKDNLLPTCRPAPSSPHRRRPPSSGPQSSWRSTRSAPTDPSGAERLSGPTAENLPGSRPAAGA